MGAETAEVRKMFESALTTTTAIEPGKLDMELLDLLKVGMKSRWMDHFSLEGCSSLAFREEGMRGLPSAGFTFMVRHRPLALPPLCPNEAKDMVVDIGFTQNGPLDVVQRENGV